MSRFPGCPYPIVKNPLGFFATQDGIDQLRSDLLILLMTNPGERVMMPTYGTPLRQFLFEQNVTGTEDDVRDVIIAAIAQREPRVTIKSINVGVSSDVALNQYDDGSQARYVLGVSIEFVDPAQRRNVQVLELQLPINGGMNSQ